MNYIELKQIRKSFGDVETMHGIDLEIKQGEFVVFVGPSGCGKSTLLRLIAGLEDITSGDLYIDGERMNDYPPSKRGVSMVFQSYALYPHMTVYENMAFGMRLAKESDQTIDEKVREAARILQLDPLLERLPKNLSGGQRQRVAIGRALVRDPKVFLLDEPLSNLDAALRVQTRLEIAKLHKTMGSTTIYVTHDQVEAMTLADKIVVLRDGYLEQVGSPMELYHKPDNLFVAGFIGSPMMNFININAERTDDNTLKCQMPGGRVMDLAIAQGSGARNATTLGIRPEHMTLGDPDNSAIYGKVNIVEQLGEAELVYIALPDDQVIVARLPGGSKTEIGSTVGVDVDLKDLHMFGADQKSILIQA